MFTYDPGFTSTASCESKITYIDGDAGILLYRGTRLNSSHTGLFSGNLLLLLSSGTPTPAQKKDFDQRVTNHTMVHEQWRGSFRASGANAHPMAVMVASVGALAAFYHDSTDHQ